MTTTRAIYQYACGKMPRLNYCWFQNRHYDRSGETSAGGLGGLGGTGGISAAWR